MDNIVFRDPQLLDEIRRYAKTKTIKRDVVLIAPGDTITFVPIVQNGILRIIRQDDEGREIFLYHLYPGQTCAMAINSASRTRRVW